MHEGKSCGIAFRAGSWPLKPDRPSIVFIHGSGQSLRFWERQVGGLCEKANTLAIDLPGHGRSDGEGMRSVQGYADAVGTFFDALPVHRPVPCGLSIGGAVVLQLLIDRPDRFTAGIPVCTGARLRVLPSILASIESDYPAFVAAVGQFAVSGKTEPATVEPLLEDIARCRPAVTLGDFQACDAFDVMARLGEIRTPVMVVTAEDDQLTPAKYGDYLHRNIPGARLTCIPDAGHFAPWEQAEAFNSAIGNFLDILS